MWRASSTRFAGAVHDRLRRQAASSDFLEPGMDMISKPFNLDALAKRVSDMLMERDQR